MEAEKCTSENPDYPGLVCALEGPHTSHFRLGYRWQDEVVRDSDGTVLYDPAAPLSERTGLEPRFASEQTIAGGQCTLCAADSPERLPWSGQRICWNCFDGQLNLLAKAIRLAGPGEHLVFGADVPEAAEAVLA
jgi:hypothetical protein